MPEERSQRPRSSSSLTSTIPEELQVALLVDSVCDAFESSWKQGRRPELDHFLEQTGLPLETLFIELVLIDVTYRQKAGESPTLDEYAQRYPHLKDVLSGITIPALTPQGNGQTDSSESVAFKSLGRFELVEELGKGAFGIVWKARDTHLQRWVALKQFRSEVSESSRRLLRREGQAVARIDHPNVVRVYEIGQGGDLDYIAFEYVPGCSLGQWLKQQPARNGVIQIPPQTAAKLAIQLASGLQAVHDRGVIHRDFKPENVLRDEQGTLKIADFGLARHSGLLATIGGDGVLLGTIPYMSPEQCRSQEITSRSDIYSLGVVLYEMLTGERPFQGDRAELLVKIENEAPIPPGKLASVPPSLENICLRALEKNPDDRYQTAAEMQADLQRFLDGETVSRRRPSWITRTRRKIQSNWITTLALVLGMVGLGAWASSSLNVPNDGKREVHLTSEPTGAKVAFIPLHPQTGAPQPNDIIHVSGTTPVTARLLPGDYLVEVYMDGNSGIFHEVYRHVPQIGELKLAVYSHTTWEGDNDTSGPVKLRKVTIPPTSITDNMVLVDGQEEFVIGETGSETWPATTIRVPAFYMDPTEVPWREEKWPFWQATSPDRAGKHIDLRWRTPDSLDHALSLSWDDAVYLAELCGKRLPDDAEFEAAATQRGTFQFDWNLLNSPKHEQSEFLPVGQPDWDRIDFDRPIFGLYSNLAEWTMTSAAESRYLHPKFGRIPLPIANSIEHHVIRGGDHETLNGNPRIDQQSRNPHARITGVRSELKQGLGARFVRSTRPRLKPEDFVSISVDH